jgi:ribonuclease P protein component
MQRRHRLRPSSGLPELRRHGRSWRHPLAVLVAQSNELSNSRFAFAASRRVGNAVTRNRAKRLLREAVRRHIPQIAPGFDCLFVARDTTASARFDEIESAVLELLRRASLLAPAAPQPGAR